MKNRKTDRSNENKILLWALGDEQKIISEILIKGDYEICIMEKDKDVEKYIEQENPDAMICGGRIAEEKNKEQLEDLNLRLEKKGIPVILVDSESRDIDYMTAFQAGVSDIVSISSPLSEVTARISKCVKEKLKTLRILQENEQLIREVRKNQQIQSKLEKMSREVERATITDDLTELYSHSYIVERLAREIEEARRYNHDLTIILFDVDHLKEINSIYGNETGDEVLIKTAFTIVRELREVDIVGRYGGQEFLVILPNTNLVDGFTVADRVRKEIEGLSWYPDALNVTLTGGVCNFHREDVGTLITKAGNLVRNAKKYGRNVVLAG